MPKIRIARPGYLRKPLLEKSYDQAKLALELKPDLAAAHLLKGNLLAAG